MEVICKDNMICTGIIPEQIDLVSVFIIMTLV